MRTWTFVILGLLLAAPALAQQYGQVVKEYTLFGGSNIDTTENVSPWIYVRGANRVEIRTWSAKAAFNAATDADSTYSDSIAIFKVGFSDSVRGATPRAVAADSVQFTAPFVDTTFKLVACAHAPVNKILRGPGNGSGLYTVVFRTAPVSVGAYGDGGIEGKYMRVYVTPLRRNTVTGGQDTAGKRTVGLKGLRMRALVIWNNGVGSGALR